MKKILIPLLIIIPINSYSAELIKDKTYRARTTIDVTDNSKNTIKVGAQSKFIIIDNDDKDKYAIKFLNIYSYGEIIPPKNRNDNNFVQYKNSEVINGDIYYLSKTEVNGVPIESRAQQSFGGVVSGPLVVPFKYRLNDKSITGDATVGYYAGWGIETNFFTLSDTYVTFTPFLSAGLTQISFTTVAADGTTKSESQSGFSWATGILIKNWDSVNIGLVYGQDRIGDKEWEYEGKGWMSISIGWEV